MKKWINRVKVETDDYLIDHPKTNKWFTWTWKFLVEAISGIIFAYGFRAFISPSSNCVYHWYVQDGDIPSTVTLESILNGSSGLGTDYQSFLNNIISPTKLISGGASGTSQGIIKFIEIFSNITQYEKLLISILYFVINIPLFIIAWKKISKQFTIFTLFNVGFVSLFNYIIPDEWIFNTVNIYNDLIARAIFGGIMTGLSSGLAMIIGTSGGGSDIVTIYISEKKSSTVGKYSLFINTGIVFAYVIFAVIATHTNPAWNTQSQSAIITMALYTVIYFFVSSMVLDVINTKNKKQELQIFTSDEKLPQVLIHAFPHSCTIVESKGAYTGKKNMMVYMVVSKSEAKKAISMVKIVDKEAFVTVVDLNQVYGRFYIKPFE